MRVGLLVVGLGAAFGLGFQSGRKWPDITGQVPEAAAASSERLSVPVPPPPKELNLSYDFDKGVLFNHEFSLTNTSGENLSEVHLAITFIGENASPEVDRYWSTWPLGVRQHFSIPMGDVHNVQRIQVRGKAEEGIVRADFTPQE